MKQRGRPRSFSRDKALRQAMNLFWEYGYEGVSVNDLANALGINKPSLYAAFESKEALFREAVSLYDETEGDAAGDVLARDIPVQEAVEIFFRANVSDYTRRGRPRGCMIVLAALIGNRENHATRQHLASLREDGRLALRTRLEEAVSGGELDANVNVDGIARFLITVLQGISVQARDGASRKQLDGIVDNLMKAWTVLAQPRVTSPRRARLS